MIKSIIDYDPTADSDPLFDSDDGMTDDILGEIEDFSIFDPVLIGISGGGTKKQI